MESLQEFTEMVANFHKRVANSDNQEISVYSSAIYRTSRSLLFHAIEAAYPNTDSYDIYTVWVDSGESIAYCVKYLQECEK
jgi:hypothetical protein